MNNEALIEEIREMHERQERREGEPPMCLSCSPADWPCDAVRAADALEAATRVPVRGEPNDGPDFAGLIQAIKQTGGSVEVAGVKIMPCDEYGRTAAVPDAATGNAEHGRLYWRRRYQSMHKRAKTAEAERDAAIRGRQEWYEGAQKITERADQAEAERDAATAAIDRGRLHDAVNAIPNHVWDAMNEIADTEGFTDALLAALDGASDNESLPNHCQSCGAWGTTEVHLRGCSLDGASEPEGIARAVVGAIGGEGR